LHKHKRYTLLHDKPDDSNAFDYMSYKKKRDEQNQTDEIEEQRLQEFTAMSEDELSLYKEIVERQITKRSDLSDEQKKAVAEQTNSELTDLYMTELSNQSFVDTIINERELVDIPSSESMEERV
jgi:CRISPR/Cas system CSM-associated protein Csm4 (group 5 of RAMP superfamily)